MVRVDWQFLTQASTVDDALACVQVDGRSLKAWLNDALTARGVDRSAVIRKSRLNQTFAYQIFAGARRPSRDKLIQLAFGMGFGAEETSELLERGGMSALRCACQRDVVIAFCLERGLDVDTCDDMLWDHHEQTLLQADA